MPLDLVPLCTLHVQLKPPIEVGAGPAGTRLIFELESVKIEGDRLSGEMAGAAATDIVTALVPVCTPSVALNWVFVLPEVVGVPVT